MENKTIEEKVRKDILWFSIAGILLMTLFVSVILAFYHFGIMDMRLDQEEQKLSLTLNQAIDTYKEDLFDAKKATFVEYLEKDIGQTEVFEAVYSFQAQQSIKADVLLFDTEKEMAFTSSEAFGQNEAFLSYIGFAIDNAKKNKEEMGQKVYRDRTKENYLILLSPVRQGTRLVGYAAALINGKEVSAVTQESLVHYVLFDKHRNVFSSSSSTFVDSSSNKVLKELKGPRITKEETSYSMIQRPINPHLNLAVYQQTNSYKQFLTGSLLALVLIGLLLILQAYYFSKRVSENSGKSVRLLTDEIGKVQENPTHRLNVQTGDEFEEVSVTINQMLTELTDLHDQNLSLATLNMETEKKKLEAQFNPHFLYNTLETIRASLYVDPSIANQLILELTAILRYSIDSRMVNVTIETDSQYIRRFLDIHTIRFEEFQYSIHLDESAKEVVVPKLFLLPLIENSLKYGFKYRRDLKIDLFIERDEQENVVLTLKDNGHALSEEDCLELNRKLQSSKEWNNHHGLWNSKRRVNLMYPHSTFVLKTDEKHTIVEIVLRELEEKKTCIES